MSYLDLSLKALASRNMSVIPVTLDTSHFETSPSYDVAPLNMPICCAVELVCVLGCWSVCVRVWVHVHRIGKNLVIH